MMNRILYSTGCAVFAPIPLADTRPCHLTVAKKERNIEAHVIGDDFHTRQCDTYVYVLLPCFECPEFMSHTT